MTSIGSDLMVPKTKKIDCDDPEVAETDPSGRYLRYNEVLGKGASKTVYKAFDGVNGIEVAWNQVKLDEVVQTPEQLQRLYKEVHLLKSLKHENIIKCYHSWVNEDHKTINMIVELFTSGSLRRYRKKHQHVDVKAIKNWARKILRGLQYLHTHNPPIAHRDLKCDNIFVNGNTGGVKIGDLGLAAVLQHSVARSVLGTPEFMAPELYEEEYNELVDIYSFGMCMLEMITCECPYTECSNPAQIYKKVTSGIKPASLSKVTDPQVKEFIEKCLLPAAERLPAVELLKDPFLASVNSAAPARHLPLSNIVPEPAQILKPESHLMDIDSDNKESSCIDDSSSREVPQPSTLKPVKVREAERFKLTGKKENDHSILMTLRISDTHGQSTKVEFMFNLHTDTSLSIVHEMVEPFNLLKEETVLLAGLMDNLIMDLADESSSASSLVITGCLSQDSSFSHNDLSSVSCPSLTVLPSAYAEQEVENHTRESLVSEMSTESIATAPFGCAGSSSSKVSKCSNSGAFGNLSLSSMPFLALDDKEHFCELKQEIDFIDSEYNRCLLELKKKREEAIEDAKKRWWLKRTSVS